MQKSSQYQDNDGHLDDADETTAGLPYTDEEAQLLRREELEYDEPTSSTNRHFPTRLQRLLHLLRGPEQPRVQTIQPYFASIQTRPVRWLEAYRLNKPVSLIPVLFLWLLIFIWFLTAQLPIQDADGNDVFNLDCTDTMWQRKNLCGIDGINCRPFSNTTFAFRCPAKCGDVQVLNPHVVGPLEVNYRPLVIGSGVYRGDSFICASAIHAGIVDGIKGGSGRVNLVGAHDDFASTKRHGIESIPFDSSFPLSFSVVLDASFESGSDPRFALLPVSVLFTVLLAIFSTSPNIFFPIFTLIFAHVSFVSDPPMASPLNVTVLPDHLSMFAKGLLPALFVAVVLYPTIIRRTLSGLTAQFEKALFWLGGFWIGALSNYTFEWIPISRLTAHDLEQQPGAKVALAIIILILVVIIVGQVYYFWLEGRLVRYLGLYGLFLLGIIVSVTLPGVNLRIHHYILALLLLPGTSLQTRPSLLYQGILLGLFVNGIARWDFDSILQTSTALREDARFNSVVPKIPEPSIQLGAETLVATFTYGNPVTKVDVISVMVNDVERGRSFYADDINGAT
ncbi:LCCL domain containing protein [Pyrenophora tritici-repentis]|uniref:LCCL domain containing protein n=1 Tax=Pyrenophora tritici-repentis TaxID=45151 RepID=A0A2W1DWV6_9PLEO|nr:LCCL domain containing protein [Pyrenophora tritici-repentis]KAI0575033.1 LCCL domain-containing protein [Pyrenophora tritici-repentis]KAI1530245.1 LCCL domain containing protein [Pyrenophora tritici-repentis]KAI1594253.1 LCCL domain containing protein [Pyrenophora tritici-repentis]PWO23778.1 reduced viability upon starvation protein 167 [Pyrenophora tritici-repentis]